MMTGTGGNRAGFRGAIGMLVCLTGCMLLPGAQAGQPGTAISVALPTAPVLVMANQVALERQGPKSAVIEYTGSAETGRYRILRDGKLVGEGELQPLPTFSEWSRDKRYFIADFSRFTVPGQYRIEAELGDAQAQSAPVQVGDQALFTTIAGKVLEYFRRSRHVGEGDRHLRIYDTQRHVNVWGGWKDAGGDTGKYLSHLGYANHFNPQQASMAAWVLAYGAHARRGQFERLGLQALVTQEAFWGADYLHRILDRDGYFYTTVFDRWGSAGAERMVTGYEGEAGTYSGLYRSAFRAGGGMAIAALARASMLAQLTGTGGEFSGDAYLSDAVRAFDHLQEFNPRYCADGRENIIDDYTALMAAVELFHATQRPHYLDAARQRAERLMLRQAADGSFNSDGASRPYYHAVEAGLPVISLTAYLDIESEPRRRQQALGVIALALRHEVSITRRVANPYDYARQRFRLAAGASRVAEAAQEGFFIPHRNETGYWWQGESARLASLSAAMVVGGNKVTAASVGDYGLPEAWASYAQHQIDWTLGRNPYGISMLFGFGTRNPPTVESSAGDMFAGGISNGITGAVDSDIGAGIAFAPGPDDAQWRWVEQWLPHSTWMLYAAMVMAQE